MELAGIYQPIAEDMKQMEDVLTFSLQPTKNNSIRKLVDFLLQSPGKRLRPALIIFCGRAVSAGNGNICDSNELVKIAAAAELIHMASLIHDDVMDDAKMRRSKPSVNAKWGNNVSIALGDYVNSKAFGMINQCKKAGIFSCMSQAIQAMCEGELLHVCERNNLNLSQEKYIVIAEKKTAALFAAGCQAGAIIGSHNQKIQATLKEFGLNFGIAFQIIDDYRDILSEDTKQGKCTGQDAVVGDITLPLLILMDISSKAECGELKNIFESRIDQAALERIRTIFLNSKAVKLTFDAALSYAERARGHLGCLENSDYKRSLNDLADFITKIDPIK